MTHPIDFPIAMALVAALGWPALAEAAAVSGDMLISGSRGWCVSGDGSKVLAATCDGSDLRQRWMLGAAALYPVSGTGLCLAGELVEGGSLSLAACDGGTAQQWTWSSSSLHDGAWALTLSNDNALMVSALQDASGQHWTRLTDLMAEVDAGRGQIVTYPISATDTASLQLEEARHMVNQLTPPTMPLPTPRNVSVFPGDVPSDAPRISAVVMLDRRFERYSHVGWSQLPRNWLATPLYAPAGETLTVTLPDDARTDGVSLRVGPHTDVIVRTQPGQTINRYTRVSLSVPLKPGTNLVRSQYGGLVIVESAESTNETLQVTIGGAVEAPYFRLGTLSNADWSVARSAPAPWAVLEGTKTVLVVPSSQVRTLADPTRVMRAYDAAQAAVMDLAGFDGSSPWHPTLQGKQWLVEDIQISHGYGHADFPIMTLLDWKLASVDAATNWGVMHETGHNYQQTCLWAERYGIESTVNLYPLYIAEVMRKHPELIDTHHYSASIAKLKYGFDFDRDTDDIDKLVFLAQLRYAFPEQGWDIFRQLNRRYRELPAGEQAAICVSRQRQTDTLYELLSDITGHDLTMHFQRWGVPISADAIARVKARSLPLPPLATWLVNPEQAGSSAQ
ncbi:M60 family metallopeptidase [Crenobacter sp. SG2303]|uniref:M60 family metallopeptidase n=1 Tax=Crenobacter oryzisoli TaxID=3056844 RepID=A0ABT7XNT9_9NEIS|nr:M60 family metallopeptidase [Crenobacter sp. SG2303]MDN0075431.1 M60 family metallopeptidase [Crenobacter sp. SG2303]